MCNEKLDESLYRVEDEAVEPFKYVGVTDLNPTLNMLDMNFVLQV